MADKRGLGNSLDIQKWFATEDGKHYKGVRQDLDPVFQRVRHLDDKVNSAPKSGNQMGWEYAGSVPVSVLIDWLHQNRYSMDQWARNEAGAKDKFKRWIFSRQNHKFLAKDAIRRHG